MNGVPSQTPSELKQRIEAANRGEAFLVYRDADGAQVIHALARDGGKTVVGRSEAVEVDLSFDGEVSRLHAELEAVGPDWVLTDEGFSRNGTFVNGEKVVGRRRLRDGDTLRFGATPAEFHDPAATPDDRTLATTSQADRPPLPDGRRRVLVSLCRPMLVGEGVALPPSNREIADELFLSVDTIKTHMRALFDHFEIGDESQNVKRVKLAERAVREGEVTARDFD